MATQTIQFETVSVSEVGSGTVTAFLFSGTTLTATLGSIAENGTLKGRNTGVVNDVAAGQYRLVVKFNAYTISESDLVVDLLLVDGTYVAYRAAVLDSAARVKLDASQPDYAPATAAAMTAAKTILDKVDTGLVLDGAVYQFTANMLELGPSGGGGGDATLAKQEEILTQLDVIQTKTDLIGTAAGATTLLAAAVLEPGTITSFPETLTIGDSYTEQNGRSIQIPIVDTDGNPISSTGSLDFANASVTFTLQRSGETDSTRVITGTASFVDPPGTGTGAGAPYAVIEIPSSETSKGLKKYKYSGILTFTWTGTGTDVMSFETDTVTFDN